MNLRVAAVALGAAAVIGIIILVEDPPRDRNPAVGLVVNPPDRLVSLEDIGRIYSEAASTGIGRNNVYMFWGLVEPQRGGFDWRHYDPLFDAADRNGLRTTLFFSVINGGTLGPFPGWMGDPDIASIDPGDVVAVLDAALSRYGSIDAVIIAGQTESQFRHGEQHIPAYAALFSEVYEGVKAAHPDVRMGNSFSLHHVLNKGLGGVVEELSGGDFVAFSYWPVDSLNDIARTPDEAGKDLKRALELAPGRAAFFEVGWSTSELIGGDEASQEEFVGVFFDFYEENKQGIEFVTWHRQYDAHEGTCVVGPEGIAGRQVDLGGSGLGGTEHVTERLDSYVCNAGLFRTDGTPKPAWDEFRARAGAPG